MITQNELSKQLGISTMTVRNRADALGFEKLYKPVPGHPGTSSRVFTYEQAEDIKNYVGNRPGRKADR